MTISIIKEKTTVIQKLKNSKTLLFKYQNTRLNTSLFISYLFCNMGKPKIRHMHCQRKEIVSKRTNEVITALRRVRKGISRIGLRINISKLQSGIRTRIVMAHDLNPS